MQHYSTAMTRQLNFIYIDILGFPETESKSLFTSLGCLCVFLTNLQRVHWGRT